MTPIAELATSTGRLSAIAERLPPGGIELAYHAAVPVVVDADLLHLIRLNFLVDPPLIVRYETEAELLLSPLFREVASGLFEIEPGLRNLLLLGLNSAFGPGRMERLALLLQRYTLKTAAWRHHPSLQLAQQVTAFSMLDPRAGEAWLADNARVAGAGSPVDHNWFVAMRQRRESYPPADATFDGVVDQVVRSATEDRATSVSILRSLAPLPGARRAADALRQLTNEQETPVAATTPVSQDSAVSPAIARRRVRLALRNARERSDLTQAQVAEAMEWSLSKVIRMENGDVSIAQNDLRALLTYLGVREREVVSELVNLARIARVRRENWWDEALMRQHLTTPVRRLAEYETDAVVIRCWSPMVLPDLLQTKQYSDVVLASGLEEIEPVRLEARKLAQARRREAFLRRTRPPTVATVLDEAVVLRRLGDADVMRAQLRDLYRLIRQQRIHLRILPLTAAPGAVPGPFELLEFAGSHRNAPDEEDQVVYTSHGQYDEIIEDRRRSHRYREVHDWLWQAARDEESSAEIVANAADANG